MPTPARHLHHVTTDQVQTSRRGACPLTQPNGGEVSGRHHQFLLGRDQRQL